ncbi:MAG: hypothetical protein ACP5O0_11150 [Acidimicrobiales bacterium]
MTTLTVAPGHTPALQDDPPQEERAGPWDRRDLTPHAVLEVAL